MRRRDLSALQQRLQTGDPPLQLLRALSKGGANADERHLKLEARVGGAAHTGMGILQLAQRPEQALERQGRRRAPVALELLRQADDQLLEPVGAFRQHQVAQVGDELLAQPRHIDAAPADPFQRGERRGRIPREGGAGEDKKLLIIREPRALGDGGEVDVRGVRPALVGQRDGIAHAALRQAGDEQRRLPVEGEALLPGDIAEPVGNVIRLDPLKIEALAAGGDGGGHLVRLGRCQDEQHMLGRLLHDLEQGVEGLGAEHVDLVDDIHALVALHRAHEGLLAQLADVIDAAVARRIDLHHVGHGIPVDPLADFACAAGVAPLRVQAVDRLGDDFGAGGLPAPAQAGEQIGMGRLSGCQLVFERLDDRCLSTDIVQRLRTVFPI